MSTTSSSTLSSQAGGGTQASTQNPQTVPASNTLNGQSTNLQPSDTVNLLTHGDGIPLGTTASSVSLSPVTTANQATHHTFNPLLLSISIVLFVAAVVIFITTTRSAKNTTK
jgi:hypothetical protein